MSKTRINDLARELEVKSKEILDVLSMVGVTEKKTHSGSLEESEAEKVRAHFRSEESPTAVVTRISRGTDNIKNKIDLSRIDRPGDVLRAIMPPQQRVASPTPQSAETQRPSANSYAASDFASGWPSSSLQRSRNSP